jgi:hypothetical protein
MRKNLRNDVVYNSLIRMKTIWCFLYFFFKHNFSCPISLLNNKFFFVKFLNNFENSVEIRNRKMDSSSFE